MKKGNQKASPFVPNSVLFVKQSDDKINISDFEDETESPSNRKKFVPPRVTLT
jgi:hypothetical protein